MSSEVTPPPEPPVARRIAHGTLVQQLGQAFMILVGLAMFTALGRELSLSELGVYGLVVSFGTYLYFALASAETAAVKAIAEALDDEARDRAFTAAVIVYGGFGVIAGVLIAGGGVLLLGLFGFSAHLVHEGRLGCVALGVVTAVGWPMRSFQDVLRGEQRFVLSSAADIAGTAATGALLLVLLLGTNAPLWTLIPVGGGAPLFLGSAALVIATLARVRLHFRPALVNRAYLRGFVRLAGYMFVAASSDLAINSLDRTIVAAFRSASTVGLYEAAVRPNTLIRTFTGSFSVTLLPLLSRFTAERDHERQRELFVRGTRYMLAAVVPPTVVLMVFSDKVLTLWLGTKFAAAAGATAIFLAWWLFAPNTSVASTLLVVDDRVRRLAAYSWAIAAVNLVLSILLTWQIGLEGVAIGTTIGYLSVFPLFMWHTFDAGIATVGDFARRVWIPAYSTGAVLAAALGLLRLVWTPDRLLGLALVCVAAVLLAWSAFYLVWLPRDERAMLRGLLRRRRAVSP